MGKTIKIKDKTAKAKAKVAAKKVKVARKTKRAIACVVAAIMLSVLACGCSTSVPASRSTTAAYDFGRIEVFGSNNTITFTIGDGAIASADSNGSSEQMTASPNNDVKPDFDLEFPTAK